MKALIVFLFIAIPLGSFLVYLKDEYGPGKGELIFFGIWLFFMAIAVGFIVRAYKRQQKRYKEAANGPT